MKPSSEMSESDKQLQELVVNIKWELSHKSKREIIGLVTELFIRHELLKLENQQLRDAQKEQK